MKNKMKLIAVIFPLAMLAVGCSKTAPVITKPAESANSSTATFTMADVAAANSQTKCYTVISGTVYDLTNWISQHPGGEKEILSICGKDGTSAFQAQHAGQAEPAADLANFKIGTLSN